MFGDSSRDPVVLLPPGDRDLFDRSTSASDLTGSAARARFREFFRNFRKDNIFIYRESLIRHWNRNEYFVEIDLTHLNEYDEVLYDGLQTRPTDILPFFEAAAKDALKLFLTNRGADAEEEMFPDFQIVLSSSQRPNVLRNLTAAEVNKLIKVPGIVISCSKIQSKATLVTFRCKSCHNIVRVAAKGPLGSVQAPFVCDRGGQPGDKCGNNPFVIMADYCEYIDQQTLKLQESPEVVPTGEMPRSILLTVDRYLVDRVTPGTRVSVMAISSLASSAGAKRKIGGPASIRTPYLRVLGLQVEAQAGGRLTSMFTPQEEEQMQRLARDPAIYDKLARSIAPQISGDYTIDIKKALACLLMGGSRKILGDGMKLRGDINVLLMGDPSTAKSQFLKFVEKASPIGVYTSGKGSSAAGLTASVIKDSRGEFYLEGGAMVLADGGVICIDEFDKMRDTDRVAIHEAMEQQTISIAKAGITTVLNSRASVLAAANPVFGRYDDLKDVGENIDLMTTILSRFDCIFIVRDVRDTERDRNIARHVLGIHVNASLSDGSVNADIDVPTMKKFVGYCRERCAPRLNEEAAAFLTSQYVQIRSQVRERELKKNSNEPPAVPITVRQLEALTRISESLAKMRLSAEATIADVEEALRLFTVSTLAASQANPALFGVSLAGSEDVQRAEDFMKRRMGIRMTVNAARVIEEAQCHGFSEDSVRRAIAAMVLRNELQELNQRKLLKRIR